MNPMQPAPEHKFAFALRTVDRPGGDASDRATGPPIDPCGFVQRLADLGAWGVSFSDDELIPPGSTVGERADIVDRFRKALDDAGMVASMATTDVSRHPAFRHGALTASDPGVRRCALQKTMRAIDVGVECGAEIHVLPSGHEGGEAPAARSVCDALDRYREAIEFLCGYAEDQGYPIRFALAPGPGGPSGEAFLPTIGHALAFIETLDHAARVGVSAVTANETMVGMNISRGVAQAVWSRKLFHIDLGARPVGRHGASAGSGAGAVEDLFLLVKLLEGSGYDGPRQFDTGTQSLDDGADVWEVAAGCMRTYLAMAAKCRRFADDLEIRDALEHTGILQLAEPTVGSYSQTAAKRLAEEEFDLQALTERGDDTAHLDQLMVELLLGLR